MVRASVGPECARQRRPKQNTGDGRIFPRGRRIQRPTLERRSFFLSFRICTVTRSRRSRASSLSRPFLKFCGFGEVRRTHGKELIRRRSVWAPFALSGDGQKSTPDPAGPPLARHYAGGQHCPSSYLLSSCRPWRRTTFSIHAASSLARWAPGKIK